MDVFLAGIIQGSIADDGVHDQDWREPIKAAFARHVPEAKVFCQWSQHPDAVSYEMPAIRETLIGGINRAGRSDVLVAYVPSASMGTAIEMYEAARGGAVVLTVSPMAANWVVRVYSDRVFPDVAALEAFLAGGELGALVDGKRKHRGSGRGR